MKIDKNALIKWGTVILILLFVIEFFWVVMYVPQQGENATPTPAPYFEGKGVGSAEVKKFTGKMIVACNESSSNLQEDLENAPGTESVFSVSKKAFIVLLNESSELNKSVEEINDVVEKNCFGEKTVLREAVLEFSEKIVFYGDDPTKNESKTIYPKQFETAFKQAGRQGVVGLVKKSSEEGDVIQAIALVKMYGEAFADIPLVEETDYSFEIR